MVEGNRVHLRAGVIIVILWFYDSQYIMNKIETSQDTMWE